MGVRVISAALLLLLAHSAVSRLARDRGCQLRNYERFAHGDDIPNEDVCLSCKCDNGRVACDMETCPELYCPDPVEEYGKCCKKCPPGCYVRENWYGANANVPSENVCETCKCDAQGQMQCENNECPPANCNDYMQEGYETCGCRRCKPGCDYGNNFYAPATPVPTSNVCETCQCSAEGELQCENIACPPVDCSEYMTEGYGTCGCRRCKTGCDYGGQFYAPETPVPSDNVCQTCVCSPQGELQCENKPCPPSNCNDYMQESYGTCGCRQCKTGCDYRGQFYAPETPVPSDNVCQTCVCSPQGELQCENKPCPPANCNAYMQEGYGTCGCRSCKTGCDYEGNFYAPSVSVPSSNVCETCECDAQGELQCQNKPCPPSNCNAYMQEGYGTCGCRRCKTGCDYDGQFYAPDTNVPSDDVCNTCTCSAAGQLQCTKKACPSTNCNGYMQEEYGTCGCRRCKTGCDYSGRFYAPDTDVPAENACETCQCTAQGQLQCVRKTCLAADCSDYMQEDYGTCGCRRCKTGCDYKDNFYAPLSPVPSDDPCKTCTCSQDGTLACDVQTCPNAYSCASSRLMAEPAYGECCPSCLVACTYRSTVYSAGDIFDHPNNTCKKCTCHDDGRVRCVGAVACPTLSCPRHLQSTPYGECCPKCPPSYGSSGHNVGYPGY